MTGSTSLDWHPLGASRGRYLAEQALRIENSEPSTREDLAAVAGPPNGSKIVDHRQARVLLINQPALRSMQFAARVDAVMEDRGKSCTMPTSNPSASP